MNSFRWALIYGSILLLLFSEFSHVITQMPQTAPEYRLNASAKEFILDKPSSYFASFLKEDVVKGKYYYNSEYSPSQLGGGAQPKFSAEFNFNPKEGYSVTDPVNNVSVIFKPKFGLKAPLQDNNMLIYPLIGIDGAKVMTVNSIELKEDIIIDSYQNDSMNFSYEVITPDSISYRMENDGSIGFYGSDPALLGSVATGSDKDSELLEKARKNSAKTNLLFSIPAPVIYEKNRTKSRSTANYVINNNVVTMHATNLKSANYPISIDPSIYIETARKLMRGNNESNIDFDAANELIKKGFTTGARFDSWSTTMNLNDGRSNGGTATAGGFIYAVGGEKISETAVAYATPGADTFVVPAGVTSLDIKAWGGGGGGGGGGKKNSGGAGAGSGFAGATITVTPLETINITVGGGGGPGAFSTGNANPTKNETGDGGGGGGYSGVDRAGTDLVIAGGGGGGGGGSRKELIKGGPPGGPGGPGGGINGVAGGASNGAVGGGGGTTSAGGAGGVTATPSNSGNAGITKSGGTGADGFYDNTCTDGSMLNGGISGGASGGEGDSCKEKFAGGGGGGAGRFGGGGGSTTSTKPGSPTKAEKDGGGGGGGGSSLTTGTAITETAGLGTVPGNDTDSNRAGAGNGGTGGPSQATGGTGSDGRVVVTYNNGGGSGARADVYWAQLSTTDNSIQSPNPGAGVCTGWCTDSLYDLPSARVGLSLVAYNGFLYAIGGEDATGTRTNTVYISKLGVNGEPSLWHPTDTNMNNWVYWYPSTNTLPAATSYGAAAAYNNRLYFAGGQTDASTGGITTIYSASFDPTGDIKAWTTVGMTALPSVRNMHTIHTYNNYMYLVGGDSNGTLKNTVDYVKINRDGTLNTWVSTDAFTTARSTWGGNYSLIWGGYLYISGGCSVVNGSGYCTTVQSDIQLASINADGSLDKWDDVYNVTNQRIGYGLVAWDGALYAIGGCGVQNVTTGYCDTLSNGEYYAVINQDGDASTVSISVPSGTGNCTGTSPFDCDIPPVGEGAGQGGQFLSASAVVNGYLYVIGGCVDYKCKDSKPAPQAATGNIYYTVINNDGTLGKPATCVGTYYGSWCVDDVNTINGTTGTAASGITVFGGRIYVVGGLMGTGNHGKLFYNTVNADGSLGGAWTNQNLSAIGMASDASYGFAYSRANPSQAGTYPGNLYFFGGCSTTDKTKCNGSFMTDVYKCWIKTDGSIETTGGSKCTKTGQLQIDSTPGTGGNDGLGAHSGTVYANYIYLVGGTSQVEIGKDDVLYAKFDDANNVVAVSGTDWIESPNKLATGRDRGFTFGYNGYLYAVGGYDGVGGGSLIPDIEFSKIDVSDGSIGTFNVSDVTINQRWGFAMAVTNSYAYAIGGCTVGSSPDNCKTFDSSVQTFQLYNNDSGAADNYAASSNLVNTDRYGASSVIYNGYIYVAGGCTVAADPCTTATNNIQYAAIDTEGNVGTWSATTANLPANRTWGQLEVAGGTLYYIGGQDSTATNEQSTVYYGTPSASTGDISTWGTATNGLPTARTQFGGSVWNDRLYVVGGLDGTATSTNTVYISPQLTSGGDITSAWTSGANLPDVARSGNTVIAYGNNLYTFGGFDGTNYLLDSQFTQINSDGTVDAWTFTTSLPNYRRQADGFASNGYLYIIGGRDTATTCQSSTLVTPISANTTIATGNNPTGIGEWYETNQNYTGDRYGASLAYSNGKLYVNGGQCNGSFTGANRSVQTAVLSQPQIAQYSRLIDTDTDVFPNRFLINGIDHSIGARWEVRYSSSTDATRAWGQETNFGDVSLGTVNSYVPLDASGVNTNFARFMYFWIEIDASQTFGFPEDVNRGPTIADITLFFTSDPSKRLRHGKTFTGGELQPIDTPPGP